MNLDLKFKIEEARELGVTAITYEGVRYEIGAAPKASAPIPDVEAQDLVKPMDFVDQMSDEEILYWSTPWYDELQAKKEQRTQQLKDEATHG